MHAIAKYRNRNEPLDYEVEKKMQWDIPQCNAWQNYILSPRIKRRRIAMMAITKRM